jgi:hypothetical protein
MRRALPGGGAALGDFIIKDVYRGRQSGYTRFKADAGI